MESKPKRVLRCAQDINAATQSTSAPNIGTSSMPSKGSVYTQSEVSTQTGELSTSASRTTNLDVGQQLAYNVAQNTQMPQEKLVKNLGVHLDHQLLRKVHIQKKKKQFDNKYKNV
jgi:hypothetical protein